jgi:hypothetical protein
MEIKYSWINTINQAWGGFCLPWNTIIVLSVISFLYLITSLCDLACKIFILECLKYAYGEIFGRIDIANLAFLLRFKLV